MKAETKQKLNKLIDVVGKVRKNTLATVGDVRAALERKADRQALDDIKASKADRTELAEMNASFIRLLSEAVGELRAETIHIVDNLDLAMVFRGDWSDMVQSYDAGDVVRMDHAGYVLTQALPDNDATSMPGKFAAWRVLWEAPPESVVIGGTGGGGGSGDYAATVHTHTESDITDLGSYITDITGESVGDLSDVTETTPADNEVMAYRSGWVNEPKRKVVTLTDAATIVVDASDGDVFTVTLGGNRTLGNPTNAVNGQILVFRIRQDGSGTRTLALDTKYRLGSDITDTTLTTTAGKTDYLTVAYHSGDDKFDVVAFVKGY